MTIKSVKEVSKLAGVSRRTLQYYDEIGLLPPSAVKESGYRQYDDEALSRLWSILFYKEIGLSLEEIRLLLDNPVETKKAFMRQHKQLLLEKQAQLKKLLRSVDRMLNDEFDISMLRDFDKKRMEIVRERYAAEIQELLESNFFLPAIKSGLLPRKMSIEDVSKIMRIDFGMIITLGLEVREKFRKAMMDGPDSLPAKEAVIAFRAFMSMLNPCDDADFRKIAQAYFVYKGDLDKKTPGLGEFVYKAILYVYPQ